MHSKLMFPRSIRYLLSVAENHSFTRAAEALHVSQPTLSQQIKLLEEALDAQLLDRSGRTVRLTDAGEVYVRHARRALEELDAAKRAVVDLEDLSRGYLRLGMTPITEYLTTSLVDEFNARGIPASPSAPWKCPRTRSKPVSPKAPSTPALPLPTPTPSEVESSKIELHTLVHGAPEPCGRVPTMRLPDARCTAMGIEVLSQEPLVMLNQNFALRRHFDLYCMEHGIHPTDCGGNQLIEHDGAVGPARSPDHRVADHHCLHAAAPLRRTSVSGTATPHDRIDRPARDLQEPGLPSLWQACRRVEFRPLADFAGSADRTTGKEVPPVKQGGCDATKQRDRGCLTGIALESAYSVSGPDQIPLNRGHNAATDLDF
jgi:DNA-binding MarR family transcriptional regulator